MEPLHYTNRLSWCLGEQQSFCLVAGEAGCPGGYMLDTPLVSLESRALHLGQGICACSVEANRPCLRANIPSLQKHLYCCVSLLFQQVNPTDPSNTASSLLTASLAGTRTLGCPEVQGSVHHCLLRATSSMHGTQM